MLGTEIKLGRLLCAGLALGAVTLVSGTSQATTGLSTIVNQGVCGDTLVPLKVDRSYWDTGFGLWGDNSCYATVTDTANPGTAHYGKISIPYIRVATQTLMTARVEALSNAAQKVCMGVYAFDNQSNLTSYTVVGCTSPTIQFPYPGCQGFQCYTTGLFQGQIWANPNGGAVLIDVSGQSGTEIRTAYLSYEMSGSAN